MKKLFSLIVVFLFLSCSNNFLDKNLLVLSPNKLLSYSEEFYSQKYVEQSEDNNGEEELKYVRQEIILDGLLFPENILWENIDFKENGFKKKLRKRSKEISEFEDIDFIKSTYLEIKNKGRIRELNERLEKEKLCLNRVNEIELLESIRLNKFSDLDFSIQSVNYLGNCEYEVISSVEDLMVMKRFQLKILYSVDSITGEIMVDEKGGIKENEYQIDIYSLLDKYMEQNKLIHGSLTMDLFQEIPNKGVYIFYGSICYGNSKFDCENQTVYISTNNNGRSWSVEFF